MHNLDFKYYSKYYYKHISGNTRPVWAGFKTAEEGRANILKINTVKVVIVKLYKLYYKSYILKVI